MNTTALKGTRNGLRGEVRHVPTRSRKRDIRTIHAVCLIRGDNTFINGKEYSIQLLPSGRVAVKDENGEMTICDAKDFDF